MNTTDILIVGGGTVGCVIARGLLAHTAFSVTMVEASDYQAHDTHPGFDDRVIALARRTVEELAQLGVNVSKTAAVPIRHIQVSDKGAAGLCRLSAEDFHVDSFGEVVSLKRLGQVLQLPASQDRFTLRCPDSVESVSRSADAVTVTLSSGQQIQTRLLVLADGGNSPVHQSLGFERQSHPYEQVAIITNVLTSEPHQHRAYERFTAHGPLAFLPFNPGTMEGRQAAHGYSVVWTVPPEQAEDIMAQPDSLFINQLQQAFGWRQGAITQVGERAMYPLSLQQAMPVTSHRTVVCGNAAQTLHPIAGQGFNLGLRDAIGLVEQLKNASDPGAFATLFAYQQARKKDKATTITLTDGLVRLFSNTMPGLIALRNIGLVAMDNNDTVKQKFVSQTTGFAPGA